MKNAMLWLLLSGLGLFFFKRRALAQDEAPGAPGAATSEPPPFPKFPHRKYPIGIGNYSELIKWASSRFNIDATTIAGIIICESSGDPNGGTLGETGIGLTGVTFTAAREMGFAGDPKTLYLPTNNLFYGVAYLVKQIQAFGSLEAGLAAYRFGPGNVRAILKKSQPLPQSYLNCVKNNAMVFSITGI